MLGEGWKGRKASVVGEGWKGREGREDIAYSNLNQQNQRVFYHHRHYRLKTRLNLLHCDFVVSHALV